MRFRIRFALPLLALCPLAGCYTSEVSLYDGVTPLRPLHNGMSFSPAEGSRLNHTLIKELTPGVYQFIDQELKGKATAGDWTYRFFALPGASDGTLVWEASGAPYCPPNRPVDTCMLYEYGLWKMTGRHIEITDIDCSKVKGVAKLPGVEEAKGDKKTCTFTRRDTLEKALRMAIAAHLKADIAIVDHP